MTIANSTDLYNFLKPVLGLPDNCKSIDIHIEANQIPTIVIESYVRTTDLLGEHLKLQTKMFELVETQVDNLA